MKKLVIIIFLIPFTFFAQNTAVASHVSAATVKNINATINLVASDADFDDLTYTIVSNPTNGSLGSISNSTVIYTPTNNYTGFDSFTFKANDGNTDSATKTVSIKVFEGYKTTQVKLGEDINGEEASDFLNGVSFNEDATIMAVGAKFNNGNGGNAFNSGHVRVYQFSDGSWSQLGNDIDGEVAGDLSGEAISLSSDGSIVAIGAANNDDNGRDSGHVRVYKYASGSWSKLGNDIDGEGARDKSGLSVSLSSDGSKVAIGAVNAKNGSNSQTGHVRVYQFSSGSWSKLGNDIDGEGLGDQSGWRVSLSSDGTIVAIGAPKNSGNGTYSGHCRVYKYSSSSWSKLGNDIDGEDAGDELGTSVSLSSDGTIVAIGARLNDGNGDKSGHVRVYKYSSDSWSKLGGDIDGEAADDGSGYSISLSSDGSIVAIGASQNDEKAANSGHVRVYQFSSGSWSQRGGDIDGEAEGDFSGYPISLSSDGSKVAIVASWNDGNGSNSGHVRVYNLVTFYNQWDGDQGTNWDTANNWSFDTAPIRSDDIKIPTGLTNYPIISVDADKFVNSITVDNGGSLILSEDSSLSITDSFTNNGTVTLNSDSNQYSSMIVGGSSSGNIIYNRYVNKVDSGEWDLIGSPVGGLLISDFVSTNSAVLATSGSTFAVGYNDNSNDSWNNYKTSTVGAAGNFVIGRGYQMATSTGATMAFTGTITTTDQTKTIINNKDNGGSRWNLIANPFTSYLAGNQNADTSNNFLTVNRGAIDQDFGAIYGWKADGTGYSTYNHTSTAIYIAPGQGFFVAAAGTGVNKTITFTKAMRTKTGADDFVANRPVNSSYEFKLKLYQNNTEIATTRFYFKEGLTLGLDPGYDAGAFNQTTAITSRLVEQDQGINFSINAMGIADMSNTVIPLVINNQEDQAFIVSIADSSIPEDINVYLEDLINGTITLLQEQNFELTPQNGISEAGRFYLHLTTATLSSEDSLNTSLLNVFKDSGNNFITIQGLKGSDTAIKLYNFLGQEVRSKILYNSSAYETISTNGLSNGIYIIQLNYNNQLLTKKVQID